METETSNGMERRQFLKAGASLLAFSSAGAMVATKASAAAETVPGGAPNANDRQYWIQSLDRVATPVLRALSEGKLKATMPVEAVPGQESKRAQYAHLEAMGRLLCGIAPWLETGPDAGEEGALRRRHADWARQAIRAGTDPASPDFMNFTKGGQPLVDAAFLALAIVRAPNELWKKLDGAARRHVVAALQATRSIQPGYTNWLLFSAMVEAAFCAMGEWWDPVRVDYAIRSLDAWYKGDGVYGDGPEFHWDYYNSFVMHPMLLNVLDALAKASPALAKRRPMTLGRARRYAAIQERLISPEGTFPPIGRSLGYRFGAFHLLADVALRRQLPDGVSPEQTRCALTAVMRRMLEAPGTFDAAGWLRVGFFGSQPSIAEDYISTGSCYLCSVAWLPLGLPAGDPFWAGSAQPWTSQKIWSGQAVKLDHALAER